jgi:hypothetical protein
VGRFTVLCFMVSSAGHVREFALDLSAVGNSYKLHYPFVSFTVSGQWSTSSCGILYSKLCFCMTPT